MSRPGWVDAIVAPGTRPIKSFSAIPLWFSGTISVGTSGLLAVRNRSAHVSVKAGICRMVLQGMMTFWPFKVTVPPARRGWVGVQMTPVVSRVASWMNPVMSNCAGTTGTAGMMGARNGSPGSAGCAWAPTPATTSTAPSDAAMTHLPMARHDCGTCR